MARNNVSYFLLRREWVGRKASLASNMIQSFRMVGHHPYATLEGNAILCFGFKKTGYYSFKREDPVVGSFIFDVLMSSTWAVKILHLQFLTTIQSAVVYRNRRCASTLGKLFGLYEKYDYSQY